MSGDEKVEVKIFVGIAERIFDLFGHFEQSDVANEFHDCTDRQDNVDVLERLMTRTRILTGHETGNEIGIRG